MNPPRVLSCCARNVFLPSWFAQYGADAQGARCGVLIDAVRRCKKPAHVIYVTLAGSGNNGSASHGVLSRKYWVLLRNRAIRIVHARSEAKMRVPNWDPF